MSSGIRNVHAMIVNPPVDGVLDTRVTHVSAVIKNGTRVIQSVKTSQNLIAVRKVFLFTDLIKSPSDWPMDMNLKTFLRK